MREKTQKFVIAFHTTSEAIAFEKGCHARSITGRLIPVPRQLSSGCGLAWASGVEEMEPLEAFMEREGMEYETKGIYLI